MAISPDAIGVCPYCATPARFERAYITTSGLAKSPSLFAEATLHPPDPTNVRVQLSENKVKVLAASCTNCSKISIVIKLLGLGGVTEATHLVWPNSAPRAIPPQVEIESPHIAQDYREAAITLESSPKASAALSRRCLQAVLREKANANQQDLVKQIAATLPLLPSYLSTNLDAIRSIGNFAAHPTKSKSTGEILDVEPGEAEWNLDVLDLLFDFYYIQPAIAQQRKDDLNKKLQDAGKPPIQE
jgi:hypothetical protein